MASQTIPSPRPDRPQTREYPEWIVEHSPSGSAYAVIGRISQYCAGGSKCWIKSRILAKELGLSLRTVGNALSFLYGIGALRREKLLQYRVEVAIFRTAPGGGSGMQQGADNSMQKVADLKLPYLITLRPGEEDPDLPPSPRPETQHISAIELKSSTHPPTPKLSDHLGTGTITPLHPVRQDTHPEQVRKNKDSKVDHCVVVRTLQRQKGLKLSGKMRSEIDEALEGINLDDDHAEAVAILFAEWARDKKAQPIAIVRGKWLQMLKDGPDAIDTLDEEPPEAVIQAAKDIPRGGVSVAAFPGPGAKLVIASRPDWEGLLALALGTWNENFPQCPVIGKVSADTRRAVMEVIAGEEELAQFVSAVKRLAVIVNHEKFSFVPNLKWFCQKGMTKVLNGEYSWAEEGTPTSSVSAGRLAFDADCFEKEGHDLARIESWVQTALYHLPAGESCVAEEHLVRYLDARRGFERYVDFGRNGTGAIGMRRNLLGILGGVAMWGYDLAALKAACPQIPESFWTRAK